MELAWVDPDSGYRYSRPSQIPVATRIGLLRRAGVSLAEIAAFLASPTLERGEAWRVALDREVAERRQLLDHVTQLINAEEAPTMTDSTHAGATKITLQRAIPVLASLDLETTQRFYADKIGFRPVARYPDYAICASDGVQLHFWLTDDADIPKETSCRIDVLGIELLYEEMTIAGVVHPNGPLRQQPWGFEEFAVVDGDGNLITFGERLDGPSESAPKRRGLLGGGPPRIAGVKSPPPHRFDGLPISGPKLPVP
jgi:catechol 2,3-dioxygenase-like lactoylglutathione lyase family enzyme